MKTSTLTRLALTVAMTAAIASISFNSYAQHGQDVSAPHKAEAQQKKQDKQESKDEKKESKEQQKQQHRLSQEQQQQRIREQKQLLAEYNQRIAEQQALALRNAQLMEQQKRRAQYSYQQAYYEQLRQQQAQLENDRHDYENDPYYYTPPAYQYRRGATTYQTNQYGADRLRQASNTGYQKGYEAGRADRQDNWRFDYRDHSRIRTPTTALTAAMWSRTTTTTISAKDSSAGMKMATTGDAPMAPVPTVRIHCSARC